MRKLRYKEMVAVGVGLALVGFLLFGASVWNLFSNPTNQAQPTTVDNTNVPASGVTSEDEVVGTGDVAQAGDTVTVNYVGELLDGKVFDSSYDRNQPFTFKLGAGQVIKGWDTGVQGMKVGGKRKLIIAPDYGYGAQNVGPIPANSTLVFEVELLNVSK